MRNDKLGISKTQLFVAILSLALLACGDPKAEAQGQTRLSGPEAMGKFVNLTTDTRAQIRNLASRLSKINADNVARDDRQALMTLLRQVDGIVSQFDGVVQRYQEATRILLAATDDPAYRERITVDLGNEVSAAKRFIDGQRKIAEQKIERIQHTLGLG